MTIQFSKRTAADHMTAHTFLDAAYDRLKKGEIFDGMERLVTELTTLRSARPRSEWLAFCQGILRQHPIFSLVHEAPFTRRAFEKPRGYPGDAVTLDFIYGLQPVAPGRSRRAVDLYAWEFQTPSCRSVRARKSLLANEIDLSGRRVPRPRILSLACGHMREARESNLLLDRSAGAFFAVDQDVESLAVVASELEAYGVRAVCGSVRSFLTREIAYSDLDLAYAAGLYDYLPDRLAVQLTARLFEMLRSGGRLVIPNFNPSLRDIGYLESFMDWNLLYRTDEDLARLLSDVKEREIAATRTFQEMHHNITFLEVTRA